MTTQCAAQFVSPGVWSPLGAVDARRDPQGRRERNEVMSMRLPEFTAEASLDITRQHHPASLTVAVRRDRELVAPQLFCPYPYVAQMVCDIDGNCEWLCARRGRPALQ